MPKLVCVRLARRSSNTLGIATVVELKITPPHAVAISRIANTRAMVARSMCRPMVFDFFCTGPGSGTSARKAMPAKKQNGPGMKKAARQPQRSMSAPATSAAAARPRLPQSPFQPSARPIFSGEATSIAIPTGW